MSVYFCNFYEIRGVSRLLFFLFFQENVCCGCLLEVSHFILAYGLMRI